MCWLIASFIDDLRVGGDPGGNLWSPSSPSSMKAVQIEATKLFAMQGRLGQLSGVAEDKAHVCQLHLGQIDLFFF